MKVLMLVTKDSTRDSRVQKEKHTLEDNGYNVTVMDYKRKPSGKLSSLLKILIWNIKTFFHLRNEFFDVVHCHDFDTLLCGVLVKWRMKNHLVYDSHELYAFAVNLRFILFFERILLRWVDKCIAVNDGVKEYLSQLGAKDITVVMNTKPHVHDIFVAPANTGFTVCYFGNLSDRRMFPDLVDIVGELKEIRFIVGGFGPYTDEVEKRCQQYDNVDFLGYVPEYDMEACILRSNLIICMPNPFNKNCLLSSPIKIFEGMAMGRPLLVTKGTLAAKLVKQFRCGFSCGYNKDDIQKVLWYLKDRSQMLKSMGMTGLMYAQDKLNWDVDKKSLLNVYKNIVRGRQKNVKNWEEHQGLETLQSI